MGQKVDDRNYMKSIVKTAELEDELDSKESNPKKVTSLVLFEGGQDDLREFFKEMVQSHTEGDATRVMLGVNHDSNVPLKQSGYRASTALLKFMAMNPEFVGELEYQSIRFLVYDAQTGTLYENLKDFYRTENWKQINREMAQAVKEVTQPEFQEKVKLVSDLERKTMGPYSEAEREQAWKEFLPLRNQVAGVNGIASSQKIVSDTILKLAESREVGKLPLARVLNNMISKKIAVENEARLKRESGKAIDPVEAARAAAREAK